jgi:Helix-turn-helix domain of resolvase
LGFGKPSKKYSFSSLREGKQPYDPFLHLCLFRAKEEVILLHQQGLNQTQIANQVKIGRSSVRRILVAAGFISVEDASTEAEDLFPQN